MIRINSFLQVVLIIIPGLFVFLTILQGIRTDDLFWHLKIGEIIIEQQELPSKEPLLFSPEKQISPVYHEWLFQVLVAKIYLNFGFFGLKFLHILLFLLFCMTLFSLINQLNIKDFIGVIFCSVILFGYPRFIQLRPQLISMFFLYFICCLYFSRKNSFKNIYVGILFLIGLLWSNFHSLAPIGLGFISFSLVGRIIEDRGILKKNISAFLGGVAFFVGMLFQPLGFKYLYFYFLGNKRNPYQNVIDEWGHFKIFNTNFDFLPLSVLDNHILLFLTLVGFCLACYHIYTKRKFWIYFDLFLASLVSLSVIVYAVRFSWLIAFPISFIYVVCRAFFKRKEVIVSFNLLFLIFLFKFVSHFEVRKYHLPINEKSHYFSEIDEDKYHSKGVDFLKDISLGGNIGNPYFLGGYLSFKLNPKYKTFVDGRFEHFSEDRNYDYGELFYFGKNFKERLDKYSFDFFILPVNKSYLKTQLALLQLGWTPIFRNISTVVLASPQVVKRSYFFDKLSKYYNKKLQNLTQLNKLVRSPFDRTISILSAREAEDLLNSKQELEILLNHLFFSELEQWFEKNKEILSLKDPRLEYFCYVFAHRNQIKSILTNN